MKGERILLVFFLFIMAFFGSQCEKNITVPENLIGVWGTTDSNYADRIFKITRSEITFQSGENTFDTYPIKKIEMEKVLGGQILLYIFHYKNTEGLKYKFSFYYDPTGQGEIRYKNQSQIVWTKKSES